MSHQRCDSTIAEPARSRRRFSALASCPGSGRAAWIAGWKLVGEPCSASSDIAQAMSAVAASLRARTRSRAAVAVMNCVPLISESPSFAASVTGVSPAAASASAARSPTSVQRRLALADERQREMRERREVAARAHRAPGRDVRDDAGVEHVDEQLHRLQPRARVPLREGVRAKEQRAADDLVRIRLPHPARVAAQETQLQLGRLLGRDRLRDEPAEAGVDAVGVLARVLLEECARGDDPLPATLGEGDPAPADRDVPDVVQHEIVAGEQERLVHGC